MNILIIGHRQHGKTDVGKLLAEALNTTAHDSSWFACERIVFPALKDKYGYATPEECHADRHNRRQEWFELIEDFNDVPDRLTRTILDEGSIYVGMRSRMEFSGSNRHFDTIVWVDASKRAPEEPWTSMKLHRDDADYVLDNNGPKGDLYKQVGLLIEWMIENPMSNDDATLVYGIDPRHHLSKGTLATFVMEQLLRDQKRLKEVFAAEHNVDVADVVTASEAMRDTHEVTKPMSPLDTMRSITEHKQRS